MSIVDFFFRNKGEEKCPRLSYIKDTKDQIVHYLNYFIDDKYLWQRLYINICEHFYILGKGTMGNGTLGNGTFQNVWREPENSILLWNGHFIIWEMGHYIPLGSGPLIHWDMGHGKLEMLSFGIRNTLGTNYLGNEVLFTSSRRIF